MLGLRRHGVSPRCFACCSACHPMCYPIIPQLPSHAVNYFCTRGPQPHRFGQILPWGFSVKCPQAANSATCCPIFVLRPIVLHTHSTPASSGLTPLFSRLPGSHAADALRPTLLPRPRQPSPNPEVPCPPCRQRHVQPPPPYTCHPAYRCLNPRPHLAVSSLQAAPRATCCCPTRSCRCTCRRRPPGPTWGCR